MKSTTQRKENITSKLIKLREDYKALIEKRLRDNQMKGVNFVIAQALDELFNELVPILKGKDGE